jgi:hypothetical protein
MQISAQTSANGILIARAHLPGEQVAKLSPERQAGFERVENGYQIVKPI